MEEKIVDGHRIVSNEEGVRVYGGNDEWISYLHDGTDGKIGVQAVSILHNYPRISPSALKAGLEMLIEDDKPAGPNCKECPYKEEADLPATPDRPFCQLARCFIDELDGLCLKKLTIEEILQRCQRYTPEKCFVKSLGDLLQCKDFTLTIE